MRVSERLAYVKIKKPGQKKTGFRAKRAQSLVDLHPTMVTQVGYAGVFFGPGVDECLNLRSEIVLYPDRVSSKCRNWGMFCSR